MVRPGPPAPDFTYPQRSALIPVDATPRGTHATPSSASRNVGSVADSTHVGVSRSQPISIEIGAMGVEARVTLQTIALGMARDARLEILSRRLTMPRDECPVAIVIPGAQRALRHQPCLLMAALAEIADVVAVTAGGLPVVCGRRVTLQEVCRMIPPAG